jgi:hypothetical protein
VQDAGDTDTGRTDADQHDNAGHVPFLEEPERFNRELAELTRRVSGAST